MRIQLQFTGTEYKLQKSNKQNFMTLTNTACFQYTHVPSPRPPDQAHLYNIYTVRQLMITKSTVYNELTQTTSVSLHCTNREVTGSLICFLSATYTLRNTFTRVTDLQYNQNVQPSYHRHNNTKGYHLVLLLFGSPNSAANRYKMSMMPLQEVAVDLHTIMSKQRKEVS